MARDWGTEEPRLGETSRLGFWREVVSLAGFCWCGKQMVDHLGLCAYGNLDMCVMEHVAVNVGPILVVRTAGVILSLRSLKAIADLRFLSGSWIKCY